jgi:hypothetical protein
MGHLGPHHTVCGVNAITWLQGVAKIQCLRRSQHFDGQHLFNIV